MAEGAVTTVPTATDRDRAITQLSQHFADDGIELDEFERRAEAVYRATTLAELQALVADVPAVIASAAVATAHASRVATSGDAPLYDRIAVVMSSTERHGPLRVARKLDVRTVMGNVEMDLTQATFAPGITEIEIKTFMGNVEIVFPEHVRVQYHGSAFMASVETLTDQEGSTANAECVVHVSGRAIMSNITLSSASGARRLKD